MAAGLVSTGSDPLDTALGGGFSHGQLVLVHTEAGAGGLEFALTLARANTRLHLGRRGLLVSVLRSTDRIQRELDSLFPREKDHGIDIHSLTGTLGGTGLAGLVSTLGEGDVLILESLGALKRGGHELSGVLQELAEQAAARNALILAMVVGQTLSSEALSAAQEAADVLLHFRWSDGGTTMRRVLTIRHVRGLAPMFETDQVPMFEIVLSRGRGFTVTRVKSVM